VRRRGRLASSAESDKTGSWNHHTIHHHSQLQSQSQSLSTSSSSSYSVEDTSTARINSPSSPNMEEFDSLRREATKLERVLEDKVSRYQQLAQRLATGGADGSDLHFSGSGRSSLLDAAETGTMPSTSTTSKNSSSDEEREERTLADDIHRALARMSDLIDSRMAPAAAQSGRSQHALLVKRYREIHFDCSADFQKTSASVSRRREAAELFRGASDRDGSADGDGDASNRDPEMEQLLRERNSLGGALRSAASVLGQASEVRSDLRNQGQSLRNVGGKVLNIASNVPGLNTLVEGIRRRRNKDDLVVSGVIAACILFTLWYLFAA